ncbi:hypothetical protein HMPREF1552_01507 [Leptotrichia sp. oral taxon 879 str. F0557]|nr:hypothetical protein HMPREF1552_01507 [Leptotrichia sp. oral taxon 879 str. F0557]
MWNSISFKVKNIYKKIEIYNFNVRIFEIYWYCNKIFLNSVLK